MSVRLQEFLFKWEEGAGSKIVTAACGMIAAIALVCLYDAFCFRNFATAESFDTAQLARNFSEGRGFTTFFVRPFSLHLVTAHRDDHRPLLNEDHPDLANAPVYPILLAGWLKLMPFDKTTGVRLESGKYLPEVWIAIFNQTLFLLSALVLYRLTRRLFDTSAAAFATAVYLGAEMFWRFSVAALPTTLLVLLFLLVAWCLVRLEEEGAAPTPRFGRVLGLVVSMGLLCGIGGLTRYSFGWLIIPIALAVAVSSAPRKWILVPLLVTLFAGVMAPWILRNLDVSGAPFGTAGYALFQGTYTFGEENLERSLGPDLNMMHPEELVRKLVLNLREIASSGLPKLAGTWAGAFFLVGLLVPFRTAVRSKLRYFLLSSLGVLTLVQALGRTHLTTASPDINSENLLAVVAPLTFAFGAGLFFILLDRLQFEWPGMRTLVASGFVFVVSLPLLLELVPPFRHPVAYPPYHPPLIERVALWVKPDETILSDVPWAVAWYGRRQSLWLTLKYQSSPADKTKDDFFAVNDYDKSIQALYLTPRTLKTMTTKVLTQSILGQGSDWEHFVAQLLLRREVPAAFPLKYSARDFLPEQLYLARRAVPVE